MYLEEAASGFEYRWAITEKGNYEPIGAIDVVGITDDNKTAEIGYVLSKKHWNKGYTTEAYKAVIDECFVTALQKLQRHTVLITLLPAELWKNAE